jgi:hypothetical protein
LLEFLNDCNEDKEEQGRKKVRVRVRGWVRVRVRVRVRGWVKVRVKDLG